RWQGLPMQRQGPACKGCDFALAATRCSAGGTVKGVLRSLRARSLDPAWGRAQSPLARVHSDCCRQSDTLPGAIGSPCVIGRRAGRIAPLSGLDALEQAVKQRLLSRNDLLFGDRDGKPLGAIDLGEALNASALWRPLQMEDITLDEAGFELALERERGNPLCPRLHYLAKGQRDAGRPDAGFF